MAATDLPPHRQRRTGLGKGRSCGRVEEQQQKIKERRHGSVRGRWSRSCVLFIYLFVYLFYFLEGLEVELWKSGRES